MSLPHVVFGTLRDHYLLLFGAAGGFGLVAGSLGAWLGARFGARPAVRRNLADTGVALATQADVHALADELQTLLIEVERIAEGQRFLAKVLSERGTSATLAPPTLPSRRESGTVTPH